MFKDNKNTQKSRIFSGNVELTRMERDKLDFILKYRGITHKKRFIDQLEIDYKIVRQEVIAKGR